MSTGCTTRWWQEEECCPTDLRYTYSYCSNEAVRRWPCCTDEVGFGVKPTTWRCNNAYQPASPCPCVDGCVCSPGGSMSQGYSSPQMESIYTPQASEPDELLLEPTPVETGQSMEPSDEWQSSPNELFSPPANQPPVDHTNPFR
ncbi:hypothetical protein [Aeoliella mucimassa]|uniref:Uncharacterized protein n=1 Tax=Aeoliella mucimassa TaxID=2527972 RepID=A0A518AK04_9BACT|nr:hypothetical protein [Aeoliella mucimassa]QDU55060.1 hypothetical protein Pan181_12460 [Aeoliella mucimassa]